MKKITLLLTFFTSVLTFSQTYQRDFNWLVPQQNITDSLVFAHDPIHNRVFASGMGGYTQESWPSFLKVNTSDFLSTGNRLEMDGEVFAAVPDGNGGFFIGGSFTLINGQSRTYLAQIDANSNLTSFNPVIDYFFPPNARIFDLKVHNNILYAGGTITNVDGQTRNNFAAFDCSTGNLLSWAPNPAGYVMTIEVVNDQILIGGSFATIDGNSRNNIAAFDLSYNLLNWNPNPDNTITKIKKAGDKLYVLGGFTTFDALSRSQFIELDSTSLSPTTLTFGNFQGGVSDVTVAQNKLFIVGNFSAVNSVPSNNCLIYDIASTVIDLNAIQADSVIWSATTDGSSVFLGGYFTELNNQEFKRFAEYSVSSQSLSNHQLSLNGRVRTVCQTANSFLFFGTFNAALTHPSNFINCFDDQNGLAVNSPIQTDGSVFNMSVDGNYLSIIGSFSSVNGEPRNRIAIYDLQGDSLMPFNPGQQQYTSVNSSSIQIIDNTLLLGYQGFSPSIIAMPIHNGDSSRVIAQMNGGFSFKAVDSLLLISGWFSTINGESRAAFGLVNWYTNEVLSLNLNLEYESSGGQIYSGHSVSDAVKWNDTLFIAGKFDFSNGQAYEGLIAVDLGTNQVTQVFNTGYYDWGRDLDLKHNILRVCTNYGGYYEYNLDDHSLNSTTGILENDVSMIEQLGNKVFAVNEADFAVYGACENESISTVSTPCSYSWNGETYIESGFYEKRISNGLGCDSVVYLNLNIQSSESYKYVHYCGTNYSSDQGQQYQNTGLYYETFQNQFACDSIVAINLHMYPTYDTTVIVVTADTSFNWVEASLVVTETGTYPHLFTTVNNCDSLVHLQITFVPPITINVSTPTETADGTMYDLFADESSQQVLVGGMFNGFGKKANLIERIIDTKDFEVMLNRDSVVQELNIADLHLSKVYQDAAGGFYLMGPFEHIGDSLRNGICRLNPDFTLSSWNRPANQYFDFNVVTSDSQYLYVFKIGSFPNMDTLYKIDHFTGQATGLNCAKSNSNYAMSMAAGPGSVYIGGNFVNGGTTYGILNYNTLTNTTSNTTISNGGSVNKLLVDGNKLYAGGNFTMMQSNTRNRIARLTISGTGSILLDTWNPNANGSVNQITVTPTKVILCGTFTTIGGQSRNGTAAFNKSTTTITGFNPGFNLEDAVLHEDKILFSFSSSNMYINGQLRNYFAAFDTTTLSLLAFDLKPSGKALFFTNDNNLYAYAVNTICYDTCVGLVYFDAQTDLRVDGPIQLPYNTPIYRIYKVGNKFFFRGTFPDDINGATVSVFAFDAQTGAFLPMPDPILTGDIIGSDEEFIYLNHATTSSGLTIPALSRLNATTLAFDPSFNFDLNLEGNQGGASEIVADENFLYLVGYFDQINGVSKNRMTKINKSNLAIDTLNYDFPTYGQIDNIEIAHDNLYVSGYFSALSLDSYDNTARYDKNTGNALAWVLPSATVNLNYVAKNNFVYMFGQFQSTDGQERRCFTLFEENSTAPYAISYDSVANSIQPVSQTIDMDIIENDMYGIFYTWGSGIAEYRVHRMCRNDEIREEAVYENEPLLWYGDTLSESGAYYHLTSNSPCDSLHIVNVLVLQEVVHDTLDVTDCGNFVWDISGQTYNTTGWYTDTVYINGNLIDSIYHLNLTILQVDSVTISQTACGSFTWMDGVTYSASTSTPTWALTNTAGCDSIITLNLTITPIDSIIMSVIACDSFTWINGITYYSSTNIPTWTLTNMTGCDSIITLNLTIRTIDSVTTIQTACHSFTWIDGITYYSSTNIPTWTLANMVGCDSVVTLNLIIKPIDSVSVFETACNSFTWMDGITYYASTNIPTWTLTNIADCDSVITLNLTIKPIDSVTVLETACDSFTWIDGITYYSSTNTPTWTLTNMAGCDSVLTLNLTLVNPLPIVIENTFSQPSHPDFCLGTFALAVSGNEDFVYNIDNGSQTINSPGYSMVNSLCPGIHDLKITDNCGDSLVTQFIISADSNYVFNNSFIDSIAVDSLGLTINNCEIFYSSIDSAYIDSIWTIGNIVHVIWKIVDANGSNFDTNTYTLNNGNGVYWLQLSIFCPQKAMGNYFTVTQAIYFNNGGISAGLSEENDSKLILYPNPTANNVTLIFEENKAQLRIYDCHGKQIQSHSIMSGEQISLKNIANGVYLFEVTTESGTVIKRVIKQ